MDQVTSVMDNENKADLPGSNYSGSVKKELDQLVIFLHHFLHLGWEVGPVDIEMEEVYPKVKNAEKLQPRHTRKVVFNKTSFVEH